MEVLQPTKDLASEGLCDLFVEFAMLAQATGNGTTRNVFQETRQINQCVAQVFRGEANLHAEEGRSLLETKILDNIGMIQILQGLTL